MTTTTTTPKYFARIENADMALVFVSEVISKKELIVKDMICKISNKVTKTGREIQEIREPFKCEKKYLETRIVKLNRRGDWKDADRNLYLEDVIKPKKMNL